MWVFLPSGESVVTAAPVTLDLHPALARGSLQLDACYPLPPAPLILLVGGPATTQREEAMWDVGARSPQFPHCPQRSGRLAGVRLPETLPPLLWRGPSVPSGRGVAAAKGAERGRGGSVCYWEVPAWGSPAARGGVLPLRSEPGCGWGETPCSWGWGQDVGLDPEIWFRASPACGGRVELGGPGGEAPGT